MALNRAPELPSLSSHSPLPNKIGIPMVLSSAEVEITGALQQRGGGVQIKLGPSPGISHMQSFPPVGFLECIFRRDSETEIAVENWQAWKGFNHPSSYGFTTVAHIWLLCLKAAATSISLKVFECNVKFSS